MTDPTRTPQTWPTLPTPPAGGFQPSTTAWAQPDATAPDSLSDPTPGSQGTTWAQPPRTEAVEEYRQPVVVPTSQHPVQSRPRHGLPERRNQTASLVRTWAWPAAIMMGLFTDHWALWVALAVVATVVASGMGGRRRN